MADLNKRLGTLPFLSGGGSQRLGGGTVSCFFNRIELDRLPIDAETSVTGYGLSLLLGGSGRFRGADGQEHLLRPGTCFRFPTRRSCRIRYDGGAPFQECCLYLDDGAAAALGALQALDDEPSCVPLRDPQPVLDAYLALHRCLRREVEGPPCEILALCCALLANVAAQATGVSRDRLVAQVMELLDQDVAERLTLPEVAMRVGVPYHELRRRFKQATGLAIGSWRIRRRMQHAKDLLATRSVQDTAEELGYPDPFTFSRQFRRQEGISPSAYQRQRRMGSAGLR